MKVLLKFWLIVILSFITILTIVSSCDNTPTAQRNTTTGTPSTSGKSGNANDREPVLSCATLDKCNNCCKDKKTCDSFEECTDDNHDKGELDLSNNECRQLDEDTINDLVGIFKIIYNPDEDSKNRKEINLYTQIDLDDNDDTEKLNLACSAVQSFPSLLDEARAKEVYNTERKAKFILGWIASKQEASELFLNIPDDEEKIKVFKALLQEAGDESGDQGVLDGLKTTVTAEDGLDDSDENKLLLQLAKDESNGFLIRQIHQYIITEGDDDEAPPLCHNDDSNTNLPAPDTTATSGDTNYYASGSAQNNANKNKHFACILGVYCSMSDTISDTKDKKDFLRSMVDEVGRTNIENFITDTAADGGLAVASRPAERWEPEVCTALKDFWNNGANLNLGLGSLD